MFQLFFSNRKCSEVIVLRIISYTLELVRIVVINTLTANCTIFDKPELSSLEGNVMYGHTYINTFASELFLLSGKKMNNFSWKKIYQIWYMSFLWQFQQEYLTKVLNICANTWVVDLDFK